MNFKDLLAALGVVLNALPQGLLALSFGFASIPTAFAFIVGALGNLFFGLVTPISFQAETITLAGTMGKDLEERLSMLVFGALLMVLIGLFGWFEKILFFIGPAITSGMMAGVGLMLAKVALSMANSNKLVGYSSIAISFLTYMFTNDLVYTITLSVIASSIIAIILKQETSTYIKEDRKIRFRRPILNLNVIRGALAMTCLNIGANIAFGNITADIADTSVNIDHLSIVSGLADFSSAIFGGGPVETVISATGSAPNPVNSGILMMVIMAIILFLGLLPKIGKYVPSESISGFLFILGAVVTVPSNALSALSVSGIPGGPLVGGITMTVTAITDPFIGMLVGIVFKFFASFLGM